jgi:hypothetical protein
MIINPDHRQYVAALEDLQSIYTNFKDRYHPIMSRMTEEQLRWLYQRDPLLREFVKIAKQVGNFADRAGIQI